MKKYNADIVKKVTGLTDDDDVISFMLFCDFKEEYLLEVHPVDLMGKIAEKYEEYVDQENIPEEHVLSRFSRPRFLYLTDLLGFYQMLAQKEHNPSAALTIQRFRGSTIPRLVMISDI